MDASLQMLRAFIFAARGEDSDARFALERGPAAANPKGGTQAAAPILNIGAQVNLLLGDFDGARELIARLLDTLRRKRHAGPGLDGGAAATFWRTGFADEWLEIAEEFAETGRVGTCEARHPGTGLGRRRALRAVGTPHEVASVARVAAEQLVREGKVVEAQPFVEAALAFYRAVGATRVMAQVEPLFAAAS